jgi:hypothetical protein
MKTIVLDREFLELDIRPGPEFEAYRRLMAADVEARLAHADRLRPCGCPGCAGTAGEPVFVTFGLQYVECPACGTLFVSPRPDETAVADFFRSTRSAAFWRTHVLAATRETRREKVFRPRARWVIDAIDRYRPGARSAVIAGYHSELLVEELGRLDPEHPPLLVANPVADLECTAAPGGRVTVAAMPLEDLRRLDRTDLFLAFDLLDRCSDVGGLIATMRDRLQPGGLVLATATLASGFDVQTLWERAPVLLPPERLNLFSTEGLTRLVGRHGFEILEFSTPGVLDAEIVQRAMHADAGGAWPRPLRQLIERADADALSAFQEHLQRFRLSSFGRVVLRATGAPDRR